MRNYIQPGECVELVAPYDRLSGEGALVGSIFGVATKDVLNTVEGTFCTKGVFDLTKTEAQAWTQGQKIYWDNGNKRCDSDSTVGPLIGTATRIEANPTTTGRVLLNGSAPATAEGAQAAIVALTDNTGGSGTHDDTLADGLTATAPAAVTAAAVAEGTLNGASDGTFEVVGDTSTGDRSAAIMNNFEELRIQGDAIVADLTELQAKLDAAVTDLTTQNQNDSDLAQKVLEIRTALINAGILTA